MMKVKVVRTAEVEIESEDFDQFKKNLALEDDSAKDQMMETDFDEEGRVVDFLVLNQSTTVEVPN
jgi:hypothetical protein